MWTKCQFVFKLNSFSPCTTFLPKNGDFFLSPPLLLCISSWLFTGSGVAPGVTPFESFLSSLFSLISMTTAFGWGGGVVTISGGGLVGLTRGIYAYIISVMENFSTQRKLNSPRMGVFLTTKAQLGWGEGEVSHTPGCILKILVQELLNRCLTVLIPRQGLFLHFLSVTWPPILHKGSNEYQKVGLSNDPCKQMSNIKIENGCGYYIKMKLLWNWNWNNFNLILN